MFRMLLLVLTIGFCICDQGAAQTVFPGTDWEVASPASQNVDPVNLEKAMVWLGSHQSKSGLVIRHGRIIAEWYFGGADQSTKFAAYSTTKSLSSLATGLAISEGKLKLSQTVGEFLPDVRPEGKRPITVKQLLSMTSGVHNEQDVHLRADLFDYCLTKAPMDHKPGEKWDYNNTGLALLGPVFKNATGEPLDEFFNKRVFAPIGIRSEDWTWEHREGHVIPFTGCHLNARSMGRVGLLVLNRGKWHDQQIIPSDWLTESIGPSQPFNPAYGYLWWSNTKNNWPNVPKDAFAALGRWDNDIFVVPSLDLVVIRQSDLEPAKGHKIGEFFQLVCDAVKKP